MKYTYAETADVDLMHPPFILLKQSFTPEFDFISAYYDDKLVFDYNTYTIKGNENDTLLLKNIMACINSDLFKYYFLMTGNVAVEKNRISFTERKKFPLNENIINNDELYELTCLKETQLSNFNIDNSINNLIFKLYNLSKMDIDLIAYMDDITIPLITNKVVLNEITEEYLEKYVHVYLNSLSALFTNKNFKVDIYINDYVIGINFNITSDESSINFFKDDDTNKILKMFGVNSYEKIGELFIKRDFKLIDSNSFSIIKTKHYSDWHEAVAWLDSGEFLQLFFEKYR